MNQTLQQELDEIARQAVSSGELPCVLALVKQHGETLAYVQEGYADLEKKAPVSRDTIFHAFSISKTVTSLAVTKALSQGLFSLDDPLSKYLPEYRDVTLKDGSRPKKKIALRDVYDMTSGISYGSWNGEIHGIQKALTKLDTPEEMSTLEVAKDIASYPLDFEPGTRWEYGTGADVISGVIEVTSHLPFEEYVHRFILDPLGMEETDFYVPEEKRSRIALAYEWQDGRLKKFDRNTLGIKFHGEKNRFSSGGAGLFSTLDDLSKLGETYLRHLPLLSKEEQDFLFTPDISKDGEISFQSDPGHPDLEQGFTYSHFLRLLPSREEAGWDGWLGACLLVSRKDDTSFVFLTHRANYGTGNVTKKMMDSIRNEAGAAK